MDQFYFSIMLSCFFIQLWERRYGFTLRYNAERMHTPSEYCKVSLINRFKLVSLFFLGLVSWLELCKWLATYLDSEAASFLHGLLQDEFICAPSFSFWAHIPIFVSHVLRNLVIINKKIATQLDTNYLIIIDPEYFLVTIVQ